MVQDLGPLVAVGERKRADGDLESDRNKQDHAVDPHDPSLLVHDAVVAQEGHQ